MRSLSQVNKSNFIRISSTILLCTYALVIMGTWGKSFNNRPRRGLNVHSAVLGDKYPEADFLCFWAASSLALAGTPVAVYNDRLKVVERQILGNEEYAQRPWFYPPTFLLIVLPLALLPFYWSLIIWSSTTFAGYLWLIKQMTPERTILWLALALPAAFQNFVRGQNAFISTLFLGGGLFLLDRHPLKAGLLLGLVSYKPQLAVLIPLVLLSGRYWKALFAAIISAGFLTIVSFMSFGYDVWLLFFKNLLTLPLHKGGAAIKYMPTFYYSMRSFGIDSTTALLLQKLFMAIILLVVVVIWIKRPPLILRGSSLIIGTLLFSPYVFLYDYTILAVPLLLWFMDNSYYNLDNYEISILALIWLFPLFPSFTYVIGIQIGPFLLLLFLFITVRRYYLYYQQVL